MAIMCNLSIKLLISIEIVLPTFGLRLVPLRLRLVQTKGRIYQSQPVLDLHPFYLID